uniref:PDZ domain-containing protein n=1 Tax=Amphiprion ocellaris TaxID=80972 RepID=A0AAQ5ZIV2_AMPOC
MLPHRVFSLFVATQSPRLQQHEDGVCMKRRCFPVKGDHNLLTPDTHTLSGVSLRPQVRSEGVATLSGHLSDSSGSKLATALTRRRLAASPTRRLRFEDETEMEAESRYLERQRRTGVLVSKPHLNLYVTGAALREAGHVADGHQRLGHRDICRSGSGVNLDLHLQPRAPDCRGRSLNRHRLNLCTEPIRETYIGSVTSAERGGAGHVSYMQVRRRANQVELHGPQVILPQATPSTDLPINPYEPLRVVPPTKPLVVGPHTVRSHSLLSRPPQHNCMKAELNQDQNQNQNQNQNQKKQGRATTAKPRREHRSGRQVKEQRPSVEEGGLNGSSDTTAESQAPPTSCNGEGQPIGTEIHSDDTSLPAHFSGRDGPSRLSLRHLFSSVRLSRTRTASLDRLSSRPRPSTYDHAPSGSRTSSSLLKKSPSAQSLSELKNSSSAQSSVSDQKKTDRSSDYKPAADQFLSRSLSVEDVGRPCSVRSVGRVLQVCSDGTVLLELHRPTGRTFGFIISRGKGRTDSGVYVEDMADGSVEKLLTGLLAVGDEILEVDGEKVSSLSLDQVTQLLIQNSSTTIRILRQRGTSPR